MLPTFLAVVAQLLVDALIVHVDSKFPITRLIKTLELER